MTHNTIALIIIYIRCVYRQWILVKNMQNYKSRAKKGVYTDIYMMDHLSTTGIEKVHRFTL